MDSNMIQMLENLPPKVRKFECHYSFEEKFNEYFDVLLKIERRPFFYKNRN